MISLSTADKEKVYKELSYKYAHEINITGAMLDAAKQYA